MKVLFAGPSLGKVDYPLDGIELRAPARQGDLMEAVLQGATAIGLVDGFFETVPSVWHKEILFALSQGVEVLGAASMGALRAAECAAFGMKPVGKIAEAYCDGLLDDDAAVAQMHGPAELGYPTFTDALVDSLANIDALLDIGAISAGEADSLRISARRLHFKDRTAHTVVLGAHIYPRHREEEVLGAYARNWRSQKSRDCELLIARLRACGNEPVLPPSWQLEEPGFWRRELARRSTAFEPRP